MKSYYRFNSAMLHPYHRFFEKIEIHYSEWTRDYTLYCNDIVMSSTTDLQTLLDRIGVSLEGVTFYTVVHNNSSCKYEIKEWKHYKINYSLQAVELDTQHVKLSELYVTLFTDRRDAVRYLIKKCNEVLEHRKELIKSCLEDMDNYKQQILEHEKEAEDAN